MVGPADFKAPAFARRNMELSETSYEIEDGVLTVTLNRPDRMNPPWGECIFWCGQQADAYEGVQSFLEKRPPKFALSAARDLPEFYPWWK